MEADAFVKLETLFPTLSEVPEKMQYAHAGGLYEGGLSYLVDGQVEIWHGETMPVLSPICIRGEGELTPRHLGEAASLDRETALKALAAAERAYDHGHGEWPTMKVGSRIDHVLRFVEAMKKVRAECVRLLMWEIAKTQPDAEKEFDRTVQYILDTVDSLKELDRASGRFSEHSEIRAQIRRAPLGVVLCMGPYNYPLNETFTTLIPALIMGNTVVVKFPRFGFLCQAPLLQCFAESFPRGVVNVINGDGRVVAGPLMEAGTLASLAFIGSSRVANILKKQHPALHRCRCILGLEAKNPGIILPDADLELAVKECLTGSLSYNGQRCTALKIIFVHESISESFVSRLSAAVDALPFGMPWERGVKLTPLPSLDIADRMTDYVADAQKGGADVCNRFGGNRTGTFFFPAVLYPCRSSMRIWQEEQFGPVVAVAPYKELREVFEYVWSSSYGQQASIFGQNPKEVGPLIDVLVNQVCRVNLNAQCQRGPDVYPFTGRKDSAEGTLSVSDALRCFSIRSMVAAPDCAANTELLTGILTQRSSHFINTDYLF